MAEPDKEKALLCSQQLNHLRAYIISLNKSIMAKEIHFIYITTASKDEARQIGRILVEEKLAACVNILDGMESIYTWENKLVADQECVLLAKTHSNKTEALTQRVRELHSYTTPCVVALPVFGDEGNPDYLKWIQESVTE